MALQQSTDSGLRELALFAGAGGSILGGKLLGWKTVCAVEINTFCARRLMQRQNEGHLPPFPIWDDVCTFDGRPWQGIVDVVSGGFPCQDISIAGKGAGIDGERSGLWSEFARIISEVRPRYAFIENSPVLTIRGLERVLCDLASLGYDAKWCVLGANAVGAPHKRDRIWIMAYTQDVANAGRERLQKSTCPGFRSVQQQEKKSKGRELSGRNAEKRSPWAVEPQLGRVANGVADRINRLKAIGNGQVPHCMALAWKILAGGII